MAARYSLGDLRSVGPLWGCLVLRDDTPYLAVFGVTPQQAQTEAALLVDRLNDPGHPFTLELIEPEKPVRRPLVVHRGGRR